MVITKRREREREREREQSKTEMCAAAFVSGVHTIQRSTVFVLLCEGEKKRGRERGEQKGERDCE